MVGADSPRDRNDSEKSLAHPVARQVVIRSFSDSTYPELIEIERHGHGFYAWGLPPSEANIENWFLMGKGDFVLVGHKGAYRHYAKVLGRYQNERAARAIWGEETPAWGLTLGLRELLGARPVIVMANGAAKASVVAAAINGPETPDCPASFVRGARRAIWILDEDAASLLRNA